MKFFCFFLFTKRRVFLDLGMVTMAGHDPIDFELFKNAIFAVADEMALTIFRTSYSGC